MKQAVISAVQKFSLHDGPGIRTVIFFKGCPLRCPWCGNPETQKKQSEVMYTKSLCIGCHCCVAACANEGIHFDETWTLEREKCIACGECEKACPTKAVMLRGEKMTLDQVMDSIRQDRAFYRKSGGGVTFSGGEPLMQAEFLAELAKKCKRENIQTAIETCGFASWQTIESLLPYIDVFLYDLKIMNARRHEEVIGAANDLILENLGKLAQTGRQIIIRVPYIKGFTDDEENLQAITDFAAQCNIKEINLLPFHNYATKKYEQLDRQYQFAQEKALRKEDLKEVQETIKRKGFIVKIGG